MSASVRAILIGAQGRMGNAISAAAAAESGLTIAASIGRGDNCSTLTNACDVVIDFSSADATAAVCQACAESGRPLVLGTTGHNAAQKDLVKETSKKIPIVYAANFSLGINALFVLARRAAALLGEDFDVKIVETHHRTKKDAPSGTAKRLAEILTETVGGKELPIHSVRAGDIVGDHEVIFAGRGERLELTHRASSRETFARGALRAAHWVIGEPDGLYSMEDVLGL